MVRQANATGVRQQQKIGAGRVDRNQRRDLELGVGKLYPHPRDAGAWSARDGQAKVHTFLPGYATGDRYTAILTMLVDERLCLSIAYELDNQREERDARSAYQTVRSALEHNGQALEGRVYLLSHQGDLKVARERLNTADGRRRYTLLEGGVGCPLVEDQALRQHVYHVSITTVVMAEFWGNNYRSYLVLKQKSSVIRSRIYAMLSSQTRSKIDLFVSKFIDDKRIPLNGVALWIANRPGANSREAEAISNPIMFEQIRAAIEASGRRCFYLADGFLNVVDGKLENRHKFNALSTPDIGKFWEADDLFKQRENQWYFLDQLLTRVKCTSLIGIRSGALEPIALLGHNVIYLEHEDMFTPERHGSWQGRVPYNRLVVCNRTGYYDSETMLARGGKPITREGKPNVVQTEVVRDRAKIRLLENLLQKRLVQHPEAYGDFYRRQHQMYPVPLRAESNPEIQRTLASVDDVIAEGVLLPRELDLLLAMIQTKLPAFRVNL
jgi:hypothetical protein